MRHASWDERALGAALALSVQALFLLLVLFSPSRHPKPAGIARETLLFFPPLAMPAPSTIDARGPRRKPIAPALAPVPPPVMAPPIVTAPAPDIRGLGQALSGCAPENFATADDSLRSRCRKLGALPAYDPDAMDHADHRDSVPGAKRWERELARKKAPFLLPCGNPRAADPVYTGACILANIANGFSFKRQYENQPGYSGEAGK